MLAVTGQVGGAAQGTFGQRGRIPGDRERAQQKGIEHQPGVVHPFAERPQAPDQQQELTSAGSFSTGVNRSAVSSIATPLV